MTKRSNDSLQGMAEIRQYVNRSEATVMDWIRNQGFPASKLGGGTWESTKSAIDEWKRKQVQNAAAEKPEAATKKKHGGTTRRKQTAV